MKNIQRKGKLAHQLSLITASFFSLLSCLLSHYSDSFIYCYKKNTALELDYFCSNLFSIAYLLCLVETSNLFTPQFLRWKIYGHSNTCPTYFIGLLSICREIMNIKVLRKLSGALQEEGITLCLDRCEGFISKSTQNNLNIYRIAKKVHLGQ